MEIGNKVEKVNGYKYPGIIVAKFKKINKIAIIPDIKV